MIETGKVKDRRTLRFNSIDEALSDANLIAAAARAGRLQCLGNWTPGQAFGHVAAFINYGFDGNPLKAPWFVKLFVRMKKNSYLNKGMGAGVKIPGVEGGTLGTEQLTVDEGLTKFRTAMERLSAAPPKEPNSLFGPLTHDEWIKLHLRHSELHFSFFVPQ